MRSPKRGFLGRVKRQKAMCGALRVAASLSLTSFVAFTASAQPTPSSPSKKSSSSSDVDKARAVFEKNLAAIRARDKAAYLACYLDSARLVRATPEGPALGYEDFAKQSGAKWPDTLAADDLK